MPSNHDQMTTPPISDEVDNHTQHRHPHAHPDDSSDSEDDELIRNARTTAELHRHDNAIFEDEDPDNALYFDKGRNGGLGVLSRVRNMVGRVMRNGTSQDSGDSWRGAYANVSSNTRKRRRARRGTGEDKEDEELVFELEEGEGRDNSFAPYKEYVDGEDEKVLVDNDGGLPPKRSKRGILIVIFGLIAALFLILLFTSYRATTLDRKENAPLRSNSTSSFAPTTLLISLDGFRADFLTRGLTPTLLSFINNGVSPKYMLPSFPSVTFPNHYTLVTGLHPESHGIVSNTFWDPALEEEFYYTDPARSMQPKWWTAEPIWVTAEKQGIRTAVHMWPGSEAHISGMDPTHLDEYNGDEKLAAKVDRILELVDLPGPDSPRADEESPRPQLIAAYVPVVDAQGHKWGPNSTQVDEAVASVDKMLASILDGLEERNLTDIINVVVVSDHGMASTDTSRLFQLEDLIDTDLIEHTDGWPLYGLRLKNKDAKHLDDVYSKLQGDLGDDPNIEVYLRSNMPERYHFSKNDRIAPLWLVPRAGWAIVKKEEFDVQQALSSGEIYHPRGLHGYDNEHPLMRAIFVARGPAFPHPPGSRVDVFQNTEVYNVVCESVGIKALPNNGTLHLPLNTTGLHSDFTDKLEPIEEPDGASSTLANSGTPTQMLSDATSDPDSNESTDDSDNEEKPDAGGVSEKNDSWLSWIKGKVKKVGHWMKKVFKVDKSEDKT